MKKYFLFFILTWFTSSVYSTSWIKTAIYQNNIWYPWEKGSYVVQSGTYNQFYVHSYFEDSSHFYFRITIDNFSIPDKKTRKTYLKNNLWYEYTGTIEYWIDDEHMNFISCISGNSVPIAACPWTKYDKTPSIIKKSPATIKIAPYEKYPVTYNLWFEGIGFAFFIYQEGY
jgi:hypothetical protein